MAAPTRTGNVCKYSIRYNDGDTERNVPGSRLRAQVCIGFNLCDRVQINYQGRGRWYAGRITSRRVQGKGHCLQRFNVGYDDGDKESNVLPTNIRRMQGARVSTFRRGQAIEANYRGRGRWYAGTIATVNSPCSYNVRYNDGDSENNVDPLKIRAQARRSCTDRNRRPCRAGFRVQGNWRGYGRYYPGTVTACTNGLFTISYDDGSREQSVLGSRLQSCQQARCNRRALTLRKGQTIQANYKGQGRWYSGVIQAVNTNTCTYTVVYCDGDRETSVPTNRARASRAACQCSRSWYQLGASVSVNYRGAGRWYNANLCGCSSRNTYKVCYADGDKEAQVPANRIRRRR